jgi:hypothetical protein
MRSNYPYGEVGKITKQSEGGFSKFGNAAAEWSRVYEHPKDFKDPYWTRLAGNF